MQPSGDSTSPLTGNGWSAKNLDAIQGAGRSLRVVFVCANVDGRVRRFRRVRRSTRQADEEPHAPPAGSSPVRRTVVFPEKANGLIVDYVRSLPRSTEKALCNLRIAGRR